MRKSSFRSVQFKMILMCLEKPYVLNPVSQNFPQNCLCFFSNVCRIDDDLLSSFQRRSLSASFFHAFLLQMISGVWCPWLCAWGSVSSSSTLQILVVFKGGVVSGGVPLYCAACTQGSYGLKKQTKKTTGNDGAPLSGPGSVRILAMVFESLGTS